MPTKIDARSGRLSFNIQHPPSASNAINHLRCLEDVPFNKVMELKSHIVGQISTPTSRCRKVVMPIPMSSS